MKYYISVLLFLLLTQDAFCQNWLWGKRGGSTSSYQEKVVDMAVDPNNNVYILSNVGQGSLNVDGHAKTSYGSTDIMIASFTCDGVYRWSKVIGGYSSDAGYSLKADTLGHIYVMGLIYPAQGASETNIHFDTDTIFTTYNIKRSAFLAQYDTSGTYKWSRMPQADTVGPYSYSNTRLIDISTDGNGNVYWLTMLSNGVYANGALVVNTLGMYILKYDQFGNYVTAINLDMVGSVGSTNYQYMRMQRDPLTNRFYIAGGFFGGTLSMGGNPITHSLYVGAFNSSGQFLWKREGTLYAPGIGFYGRPYIDTAHKIYLAGVSIQPDSFNNYAITSSNGCALVVKLDTNGNNIWITNSLLSTPQYCAGIAVNNSNEAMIVGTYSGSVQWPGYTGWAPTYIANQGYNMFTTRFNAQTGAVLKVDTLGSDFGVDDFSTGIIADKKSNFYLGGQFGGDLYLPNDTLHTLGGPFDFVVAKYGFANCNCTNTPTANFTYTANSATHIANFTFTGTMPVDSVHWTFGDGGTSNQTNPSHTYANNNSYNVCVTVYTPCGSDTYCHQATTSVAIISSFPDVAIYPNPTSSVLHIDNLKESASYRIVNLIGSTIQQGTVQSGSDEISLKEIPSGIYLLQLTNHAGQREVVRVVKE